MQHIQDAIYSITGKQVAGHQQVSGSQKDTHARPSAKRKEELTKILAKVCSLQKGFGKNNEELETLVDGFAWATLDYTGAEIANGFRAYIMKKNDIPAPADIIKLMNETRTSQEFVEPDLERLRQYREKGIPLTPKQKQVLDASGQQ